MISDLNILELLLAIFITQLLFHNPAVGIDLYAYIYLPNTYLDFSGLLNVIPSVFSGIFLFVFLLLLILLVVLLLLLMLIWFQSSNFWW